MVILIIAILVSLIGSAAFKAMGKIPEVQTRTEISELEMALGAFMTDYGLEHSTAQLAHSERAYSHGAFTFR